MFRFASIPRCASRTLKALGLLGEVDGRCHTRITEYPDWQKYEWMAVDRPAADWYASWWRACRDQRNLLAYEWGFRYESMEEDLAQLQHPEFLQSVPLRWGLNQWVPMDFLDVYPGYLARGLGLKELCFDTVTCGIPCNTVPLADLDSWLRARGYSPIHANASAEVYA
jgi:hypothetical protein